jgi:predicted metal-dependent hydrolase
MTQSTFTFEWPPPYKIKKHRQAKYVKIRTGQDYCLEITTPMRFNIKDIPSILEEHKTWITNQFAKLSKKQFNILPDCINLNAINETWSIQSLACDAKLEMFVRPTKEIVFVGKVQAITWYREKLISWARKQAKKYLSIELEKLSKEMKLSYDSLTIRDQKTRWGSCSSNKSINLSYKLIFLPPRLSRHVMIHELSHLEHLNHSEKFWNKVAELDPDWRIHKRELRHANQYVPDWI